MHLPRTEAAAAGAQYDDRLHRAEFGCAGEGPLPLQARRTGPGLEEVVNQRQVQYSNLPPGNYRFRVIACNNSGVWNEQGAFLDFSIAPAYYQTNWFRALCALTFLAMLWTVYQLRVRALKQRQALTIRLR